VLSLIKLFPSALILVFFEKVLPQNNCRTTSKKRENVMYAWTNISIRSKVISAFSVVLLGTIGLGLFGMSRTAEVNNAALDIRDNWAPAASGLSKLLTAMEEFRLRECRVIIQALSGDAVDKNIFDTAKAAADKAYKDYQPLIARGTEDERLMQQFGVAWSNSVANSDKILALVAKGETKASVDFFLGEDRKAYEEAKKPLVADMLFNENGSKAAANHGTETYASAWLLTIVALIATVLLGIVASFAIIAGVASPIRRITGVVNRLASGDRAIMVADAERGDEVGTLARALQVFKDAMIRAEAMAATQESDRQAKEHRALALEQLVRSFEGKVAVMVKSLAGAATEMQATSNAMAATAEQTNQRSSVVATAAEQTSVNVQTVATATEELSASVREIGQQVTTSRDIAARALSESADTASTVRLLSESTQRIGAVAQMISSIAGQTNLLALNATIEAARAGDAGKGFAVVASEVKSLANQTAKATGDIHGQINEVQELTAKTVSAIENMGRTISEMADIAITISAAIQEQGAATQEIARSANEAAKGTEDVTNNIGGVREATATTGASANQILASAADLSKQAEDLNSEVGSFIVGVKAA